MYCGVLGSLMSGFPNHIKRKKNAKQNKQTKKYSFTNSVPMWPVSHWGILLKYSLGPSGVPNGIGAGHHFSSKHLQMVLHVKIKIWATILQLKKKSSKQNFVKTNSKKHLKNNCLIKKYSAT